MKECAEWGRQSREKFNARMKADANKKAKTAVQYSSGDLVSLREERFQGTDKKIKLPFKGPFKTLDEAGHGDTEYTIQRVGEGVRVKMRVHADRLIEYTEIMELNKEKWWWSQQKRMRRKKYMKSK